MFRLQTKTTTPNELIRAILRTNADMLWFGGIGTYVKHSNETDEQVDDRINDPLRVSAKELRVKVVGEGANLALTQRARIEFAQNGGLINTDAVDNSAGVNSSDMEVNIKIALADAEEKKYITRAQRNRLLEKMTDEVAQLVLYNNIQQNLCISIALINGDFRTHIAMMRDLENSGLLDRKLEALPNDEEIIQRQEKGIKLTRPEIAVLMAYAKITLFEEIKNSNIPDIKNLQKDLIDYFPTPMRKKYQNEILQHRLRREIIATNLVNSIINRGGPDFIYRLKAQTNAHVTEIIHAFIMTREVFQIRKWRDLIEDLGKNVEWEKRAQLHIMLLHFLYNQTLWFIHNMAQIKKHDKKQAPENIIDIYHNAVKKLIPLIPELITEKMRQQQKKKSEQLKSKKINENAVNIFASLPWIVDMCDIISISQRAHLPIEAVAKGFFILNEELEITQLIQYAENMKTTQYYEQTAINSLLHHIRTTRMHIVFDMLNGVKQKNIKKITAENIYRKWYEKRRDTIQYAKNKLTEIIAEDSFSLAQLYVAAQILQTLEHKNNTS